MSNLNGVGRLTPHEIAREIASEDKYSVNDQCRDDQALTPIIAVGLLLAILTFMALAGAAMWTVIRPMLAIIWI